MQNYVLVLLEQKTFKLVERTTEWQELSEDLKLAVFGRSPEAQEVEDHIDMTESEVRGV